MKWKNSYIYYRAKQNFTDLFSPNGISNIHYSLPKIAFICGGDANIHNNRKHMEVYFEKYFNRYLTFRAEDAWDVIQRNDKKANALELEQWLADFSDIVIIIVESFGTVAELGAFSLSNKLRKKLLPILDKKYENDTSFIRSGPIKWVDKDSKYGPCIYTNHNSILECMDEVEERINKKSWEISTSIDGVQRFPNKVLLFYFVYLLTALGPIDLEEIVDITKSTLKIEDKNKIHFIISMGVALKIFQEIEHQNEKYYICVDFKKLFSSDTVKQHLYKIQSIRAKNLNLLLQIREYKDLLKALHDKRNS